MSDKRKPSGHAPTKHDEEPQQQSLFGEQESAEDATPADQSKAHRPKVDEPRLEPAEPSSQARVDQSLDSDSEDDGRRDEVDHPGDERASSSDGSPQPSKTVPSQDVPSHGDSLPVVPSSVVPSSDLSSGDVPSPDVEPPEIEWAEDRRRASPGPRRHFLGWTKPVAPMAAEWLFENAAGRGIEAGFGSVCIVVPGRRSGRLLMTAMVEEGSRRGFEAFAAPELLTPGNLPERFLEIEREVVPEIAARVLIAEELRRLGGDASRALTLEEALGELPEHSDWLSWLEFATRIETLRREVGTQGIGLAAASSRLSQVLDSHAEEQARWDSLVQVDRWLVAGLARHGVASQATARVETLREGKHRSLSSLPEKVVLVGISDFAPLFRSSLSSVYGDSGQRIDGGGVDVLIGAPASEHQRFDDWGCPEVGSWSPRDSPLTAAVAELSSGGTASDFDRRRTFCERPADQVGEALSAIGAWSVGSGAGSGRARTGLALSDIAVGVGDEDSALRVLEGLRARGLEGHSPIGTLLVQTEPLVALRALCDFQAEPGLRQLIGVLRVPILNWRLSSTFDEIFVAGASENLVESDGTDDHDADSQRVDDQQPSESQSASTKEIESREVANRKAESREGADREVAPLPALNTEDRDLHACYEARDWLGFVQRAAYLRIGQRIFGADNPPVKGDSVERVLQVLSAIARALLVEEDLLETFDGSMRKLIRASLGSTDLDMGGTAQPVVQCAETFSHCLFRLFEGLVPTESDSTEDGGHSDHRPILNVDQLGEAVEAIIEALRSVTSLVGPPALTLSEAFAVFFDQRERLPEAPQADGVEVLGWLELAMDVAPAVIVTDLNEGVIPGSGGGDPLLPESTRVVLGLQSDSQRSTRDAFLLTQLLESRDKVLLLSCRRSEAGEPRLPSRLLMTGEGEQLANNVRLAFGADSEAGGELNAEINSRRSPLWLVDSAHPSASPGLLTKYSPSPPDSEAILANPFFRKRIERLRATDFKAYLECPYRFFLRRILQVEAPPELASELDPGRFGTIVHEVLNQFGSREEAQSQDWEEIEQLLETLTRRTVRRALGTDLPTPARLQLHHLTHRWRQFARWQADANSEGWRIQPGLLERDLKLTLDVDGEPVEIVGRIDRVDRHPEHGYRLLDYKSSDSPPNPKRAIKTQDTEAGRVSRWVDFQLPLYREMALHSRALFDPRAPLSVGYLRLSKKLSYPVLREAEFDDEQYAAALVEAKEVVRQLRSATFWPPSNPPRYSDGLEWAAGDSLPALGVNS